MVSVGQVVMVEHVGSLKKNIELKLFALVDSLLIPCQYRYFYIVYGNEILD